MSNILNPLDVSYSQVSVFDGSLKEPFNLWTEKHVSQGFSWRPGSASFRTIEESGLHSLEIAAISNDVEISSDAQRVIEVPFEVPSSGNIEIASISDSRHLILPPGHYALRFECSSHDGRNKIKFLFIKNKNVGFHVLRADSDISGISNFLLEASPAR